MVILNIDTATTIGSVSLAIDGKAVQTLTNNKQQDHAASIVGFVQALMKENNITPSQIDAIAVSAGPGSYTGLRVGVATAKGLCYAWNKPLIAVSTLQLMAAGLYAGVQDNEAWYCPMIDARRQEVFTAIYDNSLKEVLPPQAMILTPESFISQLDQKKIFFFGDGSPKWELMLSSHKNAIFAKYVISAAHMSALSAKFYTEKQFVDLAYFSPFYLKQFYTPKSPNTNV
ncbi:tRNA threonylcarbamoyladenosine biosynthesis protein TsaB [Chitinophaga terrae (ex Kim and Jung 2007)]|uniref:N(6)-L-threonylcarbamoyladenine synthase n=1 Tax=Chitinophaga terrae (ex Kim and Jung 2007) TaxID=408074 RepID=A0A1H3XQ32_9BACT|nr:tRNA (adenosine(37)-N6)-threonylcarbamoyltransferase complex dimerization subunit type 1 TsaB [Chitinophaga terrae (ex Kim and Jung 2007)]MDQ0105649.1 tRNA threonylcarbamoyladenosine biosynthesis protein TsaB [Chitinophaga terrae (ex Kim and Jung 2007)]GEP89323.1 tRNA (adenosine(37)-N6)-threonylcarbamoyltransferase complex dimerization subunit type 1 TsaB [Chitinophaga terrae (ex Kim and Jung 2007)]SEA01575.1 tRNA threonylcarbamoyladenosine biosynthesis protein TsaB [Chitinophaga terrae (ex K